MPKLFGVDSNKGFFGALVEADLLANGAGATFFPFGAILVVLVWMDWSEDIFFQYGAGMRTEARVWDHHAVVQVVQSCRSRVTVTVFQVMVTSQKRVELFLQRDYLWSFVILVTLELTCVLGVVV